MSIESGFPPARGAVLLLAAGLWLGTAGLQAAGPEFVLQNKPVRPDPFAETPLQLNPPTFRWPAENDPQAVFRLELSRTADFAAPRVEIVRDLFFRPTEPLEAGTWHWRVRREDPVPGPWLGPERFEITPELPKWSIGSWTQWLDRLPETHPHTYLTVEEVPELQANARRLGAALDPWIKKTREGLSAPFSLQEWQDQVPPDADPFAQDSPSRKRLVWASKRAASAASQPAADGAWLWLATGDAWYVGPVKARALQIAGFDPEGFISDRNTGHDLGNVDFGNAVLVHNLGVVYDLMHEKFTPDERARLRAAIMARAAPMFAKMRRAPLELMRAHAWQHGFLDAMVGALAVMREEPQARAWVELGLKSFVALYPWYGGNDGGSQEGPRYYHGAGMLPSLNTLDLFRSAFGLRLEEGNPWFRNNPYFLLYSFPPGSLQTQLGDANPGRHGPGDDTLHPAGKARFAAQRMADLHGNGYLAAYAAAVPADNIGLSVSELLRWSTGIHQPPADLAGLPAARLFADVGTVFTHSHLTDPADNVRLIFHATPYGGHGHSHADQNSFHLIAYNEHLLLDAGYYTPTGDPHREQYYVRTPAHNTILVDGTGQPWGDTTGHACISHFEQTDDWVSFTGSAATAYQEAPLDRFDRHVVWLRGDEVQTYVIIDDLVAADNRARRFDWLLHAPNEMTIAPAARTVLARGEIGEALVTFLAPRTLGFAQTSGFPVPAVYWRQGMNYELPHQWHLTVTPPPAVRERFVTVIQVAKRGVAKPALQAILGGVETAGWRVWLPEGEQRVIIRRSLPTEP
ncbi:MAG: DUF4962 domain-containing protein [Opitutaceae bacterium]|nr:DUF4962 domain-containing protein [Opitutaceae bacterium]